VRLLLDTHVLIWLMTGEPVAKDGVNAIADPRNTVFVSVASLWEIAIKQGRGRLTPPEDTAEAAVAAGFDILGIDPSHVRAVRDLPDHHRDPFDRILVAQARHEQLTLVTRNRRLSEYDVTILVV